jgi:hypothetical protein
MLRSKSHLSHCVWPSTPSQAQSNMQYMLNFTPYQYGFYQQSVNLDDGKPSFVEADHDICLSAAADKQSM